MGGYGKSGKSYGGIKKNILPTAISHYESGKLIVSRAEIKRVSLNYCKHTLADNEPSQAYVGMIKSKTENVRNQLLACDGTLHIKEAIKKEAD